MDWLRRNWPDLLIGIALVLVIAGIIVTLLGGGSVFDFARSPRTTPSAPTAGTQQERVADPALDGTTDEAVSPLVRPQAADEAADVTTGETVGETAPASPADTVQTPTITPVQPGAPVATDGGETIAPESPAEVTVEPVGEAATAPAATPAAPAEGGIVAVNGEAPWRILTGTFRIRENAERLAEELRAEGHPVFIAQQDDLNMVLVGPFEDEARTRSLASELQAEGRDTYIYRFAADTAPAETATTPVETAPPAPAATTPAATTAPGTTAPGTTPDTAPAPVAATDAQDVRYVQVGAYRTAESAAPQRERLEALGFRVSSSATEGGLIRLFVGPFETDDLQSVRQRLDDQGIEHAPGPASLN